MNLEEITWKHVFNSNLKHYGYIGFARDAAFAAQYPYFAWNGRVYYTDGGNDTGLIIEDLE